MNIFSEIPGTSGEQRVSAILRYLLLRSQDIRSNVLQSISDASPVGPIASASYFSCYLEHPTNDVVHGRGRLDIVIEADDALVGIENKLFAPLLPGQPDRYLATLEGIATRLEAIRLSGMRYFLVVLAPRRREAEIRRLVNAATCVFVSWEEIVRCIRNTLTTLDPTSHVIASEFVEYVESLISPLHDFKRWARHLWRLANLRGSVLHGKLLAALQNILPQHPNSKYRTTEDYAGYTFYWETGRYVGWIGFVNRRKIDVVNFVDDHLAELIIVTNLNVDTTKISDACTPITPPFNWYPDHQNIRAWRVDFGPDRPEWSTLEHWHEVLQPFVDAVAAQQAGVP